MNDSAYDEGCIILLLHPPTQQLFTCAQISTKFSLHPAHIPTPYPRTNAHRKNIERCRVPKNQIRQASDLGTTSNHII